MVKVDVVDHKVSNASDGRRTFQRAFVFFLRHRPPTKYRRLSVGEIKKPSSHMSPTFDDLLLVADDEEYMYLLKRTKH